MTASRESRELSVWAVGLSLLLTAGCTSSTGRDEENLLSGCTTTITRSDDVAVALAAASPGDTLCFTGSDLSDAQVTTSTSGTAQAPIRLVSDGAAVRDVHIAADHIVIEGFTVTGGDAMFLDGAGITAQNNTVRDTQRVGIVCMPCTDSTIASNTVQNVSTTGIFITGQRITVTGNTISGTVARNDGDADGMRFFGNGHRITGNTIRDITAKGYSAPPHPDCFQTYDHAIPTFDVVISGNTCRNVDAQCLIATDDQPGTSAAPAGSTSITFAENICEPNGAQGVNLRRWSNAVVRQNKFSGPRLLRAVFISNNSTRCTVIANTTANGVRTVEVDDTSRQGVNQHSNTPE